MNWKPPTTEAGWEECLSAYADNELDDETAAALETLLIHDEKRATQLEALGQTSALLQEWAIDAPPPTAALLNGMDDQSTPPKSRDWFMRIPLLHGGGLRVAAAFAIGVLAGGWMMSPNRSTTPPPKTELTVQQTPLAPAQFIVSKDRADAVFKEVEAAALTQRIKQAAQDRHWKNAVEGLERMNAEYPETEAAVTFAKESLTRRILQRSFRGRI